ncbi:MAG: class I SAM-dependent methyltransferase [Natronomonas sp.]
MPTQDRSEPPWRETALLWTARRCGALEALSTTAGTPEAVAAATDIDSEAAERLVAALQSRGFLARVDGEYEPTNRLLGFLTKTDLRSIGRLPAELDAFERWVALPETLAGRAVPEQPDGLRNELGGEATIDEACLRSEVTTAVHAAPDGDRVVAVGDGAGRRAVEFARRGWSVTLLDSEERIDAAEPLLRRESVDLRRGDGTEIPPCDLVIGIETLSRRDGDSAADHVAAAAAAAPAAVFFDTFGGETLGAALVDIDRLAAGEGRVHGVGTARSWLEGPFDDVAVEAVPASHRSALVGRSIQ